MVFHRIHTETGCCLLQALCPRLAVFHPGGIKCETCQQAGVVSLYEGETGRNGYTREKEHLDALRLENEDNALWKHCLIQHNGEKAKFSMKVLGVFYTCLVRQVNEGVRIQKSRAHCVMNSKSEFHQHPVVRIVPMRGVQEEQGEGRGTGRGGGRGRGQGRGRGPRGASRRQVNWPAPLDLFSFSLDHIICLFHMTSVVAWRRTEKEFETVA